LRLTAPVKGSFLMSKQLGLQQFGSKGSAVHDNKGTLVPHASLVNGGCHKLRARLRPAVKL
jgi:hypothetical protein